ncbi:MAG: hypothetical protein U9N30_04980 [Campylobacterota bacterium]|nr:hypothetical protein [Campylobacterota bacterium]
MSMKENVGYIKDELNSEEKFLESFVKVERFYKKNKMLILGASTVAILGIVGFATNSYITASNYNESNTAYSALLEDINDSAALTTLQSKNPQLAKIMEAKIAKAQNKPVVLDIPFLKELSSYDVAMQKSDLAGLSSVVMQNDFVLKEYALFQKALLQAQKEQYAQAKETLKLIPQGSQVQQVATLLKHFLLTK